MKYALIGEKLGHSFSKPIHEMFGNAEYGIVEIPRDKLEDFILNSDYKGLNVTIPYKKDVMKYCDSLSDAASKIGSVNTLIRRGNQLIGDNTDIYGFLSSADSIGIDFKGKKTVIFGSGGTSNTVDYAVKSRGGRTVIISRNGENNYENLNLHYDADIVVNTTPVGMYPNFDNSICDLSWFNNLSGVIDVVYNPINTRLLQQAKALGIRHIGGLHMLVSQAKRAEELFFDKEIDISVSSVLNELENDICNLVIIGMPGSGKSTIGKLIAKEFCMNYIDTDIEIERESKLTIPEIFEKYGELHFRNLESEAIKRASVLKNTVISTGGGAILRDENRSNLKMNSTVVFIDRDLEKLATGGRPLSKNLDAIKAILDVRLPIYRELSDVIVSNNGSVEDAVLNVLKAVNR